MLVAMLHIDIIILGNHPCGFKVNGSIYLVLLTMLALPRVKVQGLTKINFNSGTQCDHPTTTNRKNAQ